MSSSRPEFLRNHSHQKWGEKHGVHAEFLPFAFWNIDPIEVLQDIRRLISETPKTAKTINVASLKDEYGHRIHGVSEKLPALFQAHGAWAAPEDDWLGRTKYVNPKYVHIGTLSDEYVATETDERIERIRNRGAFGVLSQTDVCPQLGLSQTGMASFLTRNNVSWGEIRSDGLQQIAQTWYTIYEWGYQWKEIADAFGYQPGGIRRGVRDNVPEGFTPPADPSLISD